MEHCNITGSIDYNLDIIVLYSTIYFKSFVVVQRMDVWQKGVRTCTCIAFISLCPFLSISHIYTFSICPCPCIYISIFVFYFFSGRDHLKLKFGQWVTSNHVQCMYKFTTCLSNIVLSRCFCWTLSKTVSNTVNILFRIFFRFLWNL